MRGTPESLAPLFDRLAALQPMRWVPEGLVCAPRAGRDVTAATIARLEAPTEPVAELPGWPPESSGWVAGWYHRTLHHAPAPPGVRELVSVPGEGFGTVPHPTTALCLQAIDTLAPAPAWDLGCGAGLLTQAWAGLHHMNVDAVDADPACVTQTRASASAAGLAAFVTGHARPIEAVEPDVAGRVVLANLSPVAHRAIAGFLRGHARAVVASGFRARDRDEVCGLYRTLGVEVTATLRAEPWWCVVMTRPGA